MITEKARESRARRALKRQGLAVHKDRVRYGGINHHGGYMVVDPYNNYVVGGHLYDLTLDDLERWARENDAAAQENAITNGTRDESD